MKRSLPNDSALKSSGWATLAGVIWESPKSFSEFTMARKRGFGDEFYFQQVARLTAGGKLLPNAAWLKEHNSGLSSWLRKHPELIAKHGQEKLKGKSDEHFLGQVELLTVSDTPIPHDAWLRNNGYRPLARWLTFHPEVIKRHGQIRKHATDAEQLQAVKKLVKGGKKIPHATWLIKNGYATLYDWLRKHPAVARKYGQAKRVNGAA